MSQNGQMILKQLRRFIVRMTGVSFPAKFWCEIFYILNQIVERRGVGGQLDLQPLIDLEDDRSFRMKEQKTLVHSNQYFNRYN